MKHSNFLNAKVASLLSKIQVWISPVCYTNHDKDINVSKSILTKVIRLH